MFNGVKLKVVQLGVLGFCFVFVSEHIFSQFGIKVPKTSPQCCITKLQAHTVNMFGLFQLKDVSATLTEGVYLVQHLKEVQPNLVNLGKHV